MPSLFALQQRFCVIEAIANQRPILNSADGPISAFQIVTGRTIQANRKHGTNCVESIIQHRSKFVNEMRFLWVSQLLIKMTRIDANKSTKVKQGDWFLSP